MKSSFWKLLFFLCVLSGTANVLAQLAPTPPPAIDSIDAQVINSWLVVVGKVDKFDEQSVTITVQETIKGDVAPKVQLPKWRWDQEKFAKWKAEGSRLLILARQGSTQAIDLSDKDFAVMLSDLTLVRDPEKALQAVRDVAQQTKGIFSVELFSMSIPSTSVAGTTLDHYRYQWIQSVQVNVPADSRLKMWALRELRSRDVQQRAVAAKALRFFRSEETIALLKPLLSDPGWLPWYRGDENRIYRQKVYAVRDSAYQTLTLYWQLQLPQPIVTEPSSIHPQAPPESVVSANMEGRALTDADLEVLATYSEIEDLNLTNTQLSETALAKIGKLASLQALYLSSSNIGDKDLKQLAGLNNLVYLNLANTAVTDKGLQTIAGWKQLKKVDLGWNVTSKGIADLRKHRRDLKVQEDPLAFLASLHPKRKDLTAKQVRFNRQPVGIFSREGFSLKAYTLIFSKGQETEVERLLSAELKKRGWAEERRRFVRPAPLEKQRIPGYTPDEIFPGLFSESGVELADGQFAVSVVLNAWPNL